MERMSIKNNWRQVTVPNNHPSGRGFQENGDDVGSWNVHHYDTHGKVVQSPLVVLQKVRKGGGFFYGKSNYENHIEGVRSQVN